MSCLLLSLLFVFPHLGARSNAASTKDILAQYYDAASPLAQRAALTRIYTRGADKLSHDDIMALATIMSELDEMKSPLLAEVPLSFQKILVAAKPKLRKLFGEPEMPRSPRATPKPDTTGRDAEQKKQEGARKQGKVSGLDEDDSGITTITIETSDKKRYKLARAIALSHDVSGVLATMVENDRDADAYPVVMSGEDFDLFNDLLDTTGNMLTAQTIERTNNAHTRAKDPNNVPPVEVETARMRKEIVDALLKELKKGPRYPLLRLERLIGRANWLDAQYPLEALVSLYADELHKEPELIQKRIAQASFPMPVKQLIALRYLLQFGTDVDALLGVKSSIPFLPYYTIATLFAYDIVPEDYLKEFPEVVTNINVLQLPLAVPPGGRAPLRVTLLAQLIIKNTPKPISILLKIKGIDLNTSDALVWAVHLAAASEDVDTMKLLLAAGANINKLDNETGYTPLITAIELGNLAAVNLLIERKADLALGNPLARALIGNLPPSPTRIPIVTALINAGIQPTTQQLYQAAANLFSCGAHGGDVCPNTTNFVPALVAGGAAAGPAIVLAHKNHNEPVAEYLMNYLGVQPRDVNDIEAERKEASTGKNEQEWIRLIMVREGKTKQQAVIEVGFRLRWSRLTSAMREQIADEFVKDRMAAANYYAQRWNQYKNGGNYQDAATWADDIKMRDFLIKAVEGTAAAKILSGLTPP